MSSSDRLIAIGVISGFLRAPLLKACSCLRMYCSCWPASSGHSGFALLPFAPVAGDARGRLGLPFSAEPAASAPRSRTGPRHASEGSGASGGNASSIRDSSTGQLRKRRGIVH